MPKFKFTGSAPSYYPVTGLFAVPDQEYDLPNAPDHQWVATESAPETPAPTPEPVPAPSPAEDAVHAAERLLEAHPELAEKLLKDGDNA